MRNHVAPLAIFEIHAYFPRWEFFPPPVTPPFKFILFLILPMVVFAHPLIVVVLKNSPILGCLYSHPSSQSVVVLCTFVYCSELFYMVGFFICIIICCTIAVAFYTTVPLFSTIVYIQQTHTFLGLIYTPLRIQTTRQSKQITLDMNIHSLLHFSTMLCII